MVIHIGIYPFDGNVTAFSTVTGRVEEYAFEKVQPEENGKVENLFCNIKKSLSDEIGNICICVDEKYVNAIRFEFIEKAKKHGFENISIIDFISALYLNAMYKSIFKSKKGDAIWIVWCGRCYIFQHIGFSIILTGSYRNLTKADKDFIKTLPSPTAIFYHFYETHKIENDSFPDAKFFYFPFFKPENAALINAKVVYGTLKTQILNLNWRFGRKVEVFIDKKSLLIVLPEENIPYEKELCVSENEEPVIIKFVENDTTITEIEVNAKSIKFSINSSGIFSFKKETDPLTDSSTTQQTASSSKNENAEVSNFYSFPTAPSNNCQTLNTNTKKIEKSSSKNETLSEPFKNEEEKIVDSNFEAKSFSYVIPEKYKNYADLARKAGKVQIDLNILEALVEIAKVEFSFENLQNLRESHESYGKAIIKIEASIKYLETKCQEFAENREPCYAKLIKSIQPLFFQHENLQKVFEENKIFLQNAKTLLSLYNKETRWINKISKNLDEMKFDDLQNYISAFDIYEKVDLEVKNREYHFEAVIKHGEEVAKLYNNEDINKYINEIINQRNGLKETLENHSPTFIEARNIIECCAKVDKIEESLRNKFKMEEKFEASILQTKQFLNVLESHLVNIVAVDEEKDKIKERILSSGTAPKVLVFLNELKIRSKNIHARCFKLCDNVKKQLLLLEKRENEEKTTSPPSDPFPIKPVNTNITSYLFPQKVSNYDNKINAVGIDLGTSRCCMAVSRNNKMETVALENAGERPLPSFVSFDEEDIKCGDVVLKGFLKYKEKYTVFDVKRFIGKEFHDIVPDRSWPFQVVEENDKVMIKTEDVHGEILKKPEEISAILLKYMKEKAKEFQGKPETKAVLTVPAAFTDSQKKSTLEAARLAGWENITLLPEPIAASFAYFNNREIPNNSNALLFDFGGGTLDVCLFKIVDQKIEIISNIGDTCLGGRDIDNLLIRYFTNALRFKYNINVNERVRRKYQLMLECQAIKHNLTLTKKDLLNVETFDSNINGIIEIERIELEELMTELLQRMKTAINQTLNNAKLSPKDIHKVLQVGGGCRMPVVKEMLKNMFKNADHCCEQQPDEVVAVGAAIYAYHLATIDV